MARHYSTKDFFRQMPNALLARYFDRWGLFGELDFAALKETQPDPPFTAWLGEKCATPVWKHRANNGRGHRISPAWC